MGLLTPVAVRIGAVSWMPRLLPLIVRVDRALGRATGGRWALLDLAGLPNLVLTVVGRRSGLPRSTPLLCAPHDGGWLIAGSYFGGPDVPVWVGNLRAAGEAQIRSGGKLADVSSRELEGEERAAAWEVLLRTWPNFARYEQRTERTIPVFELRPRPSAAGAADAGPPTGRLRFEGRIVSVGTTSGHRIVVGAWHRSPLGAFADVMHERPDGTRRLLAPTDGVAAFVASTYAFDEVVVTACTARFRDAVLEVRAGDLVLDVELGPRTLLGAALRLLPRRLATAPRWCAAVDPVARLLVRGVRTRGSAGGGRTEHYGATDQRSVTGLRGTVGGVDLGGLADVWPPVRFGFGSAPRRPSAVDLVTTVDVPAPGVAG